MFSIQGYKFGVKMKYHKRSCANAKIVELWLADGVNKKIALYVADLGQLNQCLDIAVENRWIWSLAVDLGMTEFHNIETTTCLVVGPAPADQLGVHFGHLKIC
jgi:peptidyl-tRNA hydrolase